MKKTVVLLGFISFFNGFSQEVPTTNAPVDPEKSKPILTTTTTTTTTISSETNKPSLFIKKHEIKAGGIKLLAGPIFEGTYEYIYSKDFTYGSSILINLNSKDYYNEEFSLTPFARFYFQETKEYGARGFFVEGFAKYFSGRYAKNNFNLNENSPKFNSTALGLSLGKKWINSTGFVLEILAGFGRTLGSNETQPAAVFRGDLNIGYRF